MKTEEDVEQLTMTATKMKNATEMVMMRIRMNAKDTVTGAEDVNVTRVPTLALESKSPSFYKK